MPELNLNPDQQALLRASLGLPPEAPLDEEQVRRFVEEAPKEGLDPEMVRQIEADYRAFRELARRDEGSFGQPGRGSVLTRPDSLVTEAPRRDYAAELGDFIDWLVQQAGREGLLEEGALEEAETVSSETLRRAIISFFEYVPPPDEVEGAIYNNDTWLEFLGNGRFRKNIDLNASVYYLTRVLLTFARLDLKASDIVRDYLLNNGVRLITNRLRQLLLPEVFIHLEQGSLSGLAPRIRQYPLLGKHPVLGEKIALLLEAGSVEKKTQLETIDMRHCLDACPEGERHEMAALLVALINQTAEEDFDLLRKFTEGSLLYLNFVVDKLSSTKVLALKNQRLLSWAIAKEMEGVLSELRIRHGDKDEDEGAISYLDDSKQFIIYNPGIETLKAMIAAFPREALRNHLNWLVNHVPKGSNTRDMRRDIAEFMLVTLMWDDPNLHGSEEIGDFLNAVVPSIDRNQPDRSDRNDTALAFARFSRTLANIRRILPKLPLHELTAQISLWRKASGKREFLNAAHLREMEERLNQMVLDHFFAACKLPPRLERKIRALYADPESVLRRDNLFLTLMGYYFFQTETGKEIVVRYLTALVADKKFEKVGLKPARATASLKIGEEQLSQQFLEILHSILGHLGVEKSAEIKHDALKAVVQNVETALRLGKPIPADRLGGWKKEIGALDVDADYPHILEVLHNIDQIAKTQAGGGSRQVETADFELTISDDLVDIALAGEYPLRTCQRLSAAGAFNSDGQPIARALHPGIFVANLRNTTTGEIVGRTVLETGGLPRMFVLVERRYLVGGVSRHDFDLLLLRQLVNQEGVDYVVFADTALHQAVMTTQVVMNLPGGFYRDTFRSGENYWASDVEKLKAIWARNPQFDPLNPESNPDPDLTGGEGNTEDGEPGIDNSPPPLSNAPSPLPLPLEGGGMKGEGDHGSGRKESYQEEFLNEPFEANPDDAEEVQEWAAELTEAVEADQETPDHLAYGGLDGYSSGLVSPYYFIAPTLATPMLANSAFVMAGL